MFSSFFLFAPFFYGYFIVLGNTRECVMQFKSITTCWVLQITSAKTQAKCKGFDFSVFNKGCTYKLSPLIILFVYLHHHISIEA